MLRHYVELVKYFWKHILISAAAAGLLCWWISTMLLSAMPLYVSTVTLNLQPSEEALIFNSGFMGVTQFNPATIIAQTQIERMISRPVAERAIDILIAENGGSMQAPPPTAFDRFRAWFFRTWAMLNYGYYVPPSERDVMISDIQSATTVELVEGSYIMLVELTHENPQLAAKAANALVKAFMEQATADFSAEAAVVDQTIAKSQAEKSTKLATLMDRRRELERTRGGRNVDEARNLLLASRASTQQALNQAEAAAKAPQDGAAPQDAGASARVAEQTAALAALDQKLGALDAVESEIEAVDLRIREAQADLSDLQTRRNSIQLAREARLSNVQIINEAQVPVYPWFPKVFVNTVIGTILGMILSIGPIVVVDVLDGRIRTGDNLKEATGARALPPITRRLWLQVRRYLQGGGTPGPDLRAFSEALSRAIVTTGRRRWPESRIMVTAFGTKEDIQRLKTAVEAAVKLAAPRTAEGEPISVLTLPRIPQINDWSLLRDDLVVVGVPAGEVMIDEAQRIAGPGADDGVETLFTVIP